MNALRAALRKITENGAPNTHPDLIDDLRRSYLHNIEVLDSAAPIHRYTCAMYALDLVEHPDYVAIVMASPEHVFASTTFVQRLIDKGILRVLPGTRRGALAVYRADGEVKHIGKLVDAARVESKWGVGYLYRHDLWEVPQQYGDDVNFVTPADLDAVLDELVEFAKENGVRFE